ncbi:MAG: hypothetical protein IJ604_14940 [Prevotella sp.]|nr:hypothetical protein [Prevotella sp.]
MAIRMNEITEKWYWNKFSRLSDVSLPQIRRFTEDHEDVYMYCFGSLEKNGNKYYLHLELNKHYPYQIYYGCYCPEPKAKPDELRREWDALLEPLRRTFTDFWGSRKIAEARIRPYYYDGFFWPFWINVEDAEEITEAVKGISVIVEVLTTEGFIFKPNGYYEKCKVVEASI